MAARIDPSLASRFRWPSRWWSRTRRPMRRSISSSVSWRNASVVFFQLQQVVLIGDDGDRAQLADLIIDFDQFLAEAVELTVSLYLLLHFLQFGSQGQVARFRLAFHPGIP